MASIAGISAAADPSSAFSISSAVAIVAAVAKTATALTHLRGITLTLPWLLALLVADVALSAVLPLSLLGPRLVYDASSRIAAFIWAWIQLIFSAIVVANHVAWSDFYMIQDLAMRAGMLGRCRYFAKVQLRLVPFLGWGLWAMGMPMVSRNWLKDKAELDRVFSGVVRGGYPTWLISFSEATRFTKKKYAESLAWCKKNDRPQPRHLLYPRTKGFITTVQHLRKASHVKAVYDFTIAYRRQGGEFQEAPSMWETLSVPGLSSRCGYEFHVHTRRFPIDSIPETDDGLAQWLERLWIEKGEWLESARQSWPTESLGQSHPS
ncbi:1-acyl-sn-glycerol-3-phosphate acyltransferase [Purpureocillium lavendulum]|uniref:1-acyl-sn-glycerol-3-phosphate acyltransferase n=1 Tax=Purpureocillium lavendulum TaxID=1247861 RepID=A0AB34G2V6_9HYPO|nr:1-acyl-sn-glycerol-3-phosphate acyltransferase [Purpureocillium lavendulum]